MGGFGSGRWGGSPTVEGCGTLKAIPITAGTARRVSNQREIALTNGTCCVRGTHCPRPVCIEPPYPRISAPNFDPSQIMVISVVSSGASFID